MRLAGVIVGAILLALLASPLASASPVSGSLTLQAPLAISDFSSQMDRFQGLYVPDASAIHTLDAHAGVAHVTITTWNSTEIQHPGGATNVLAPFPSQESYELHDVALRLLASSGSMGAYPAGQPATLSLDANGTASLAPTANAWIGTPAAQSTTDASDSPNVQYYSRTLSGPGLLTNGSGRLSIEGGAALWLKGPTVEITATENATRLQTGVEAVPDPVLRGVTHYRISVAVVSFDSGSVNLDAASAVNALADKATLSWNGQAVSYAMDADLTTPSATYRAASPQAVELVGNLHANLRPIVAQGAVVGLMDIRGDLAATSIRGQAREAAPAGAAVWGIVGVGSGVLLTVGFAFGAVVLLRRRHAAQPSRAEAETGFEDPLAFFRKNVAEAILSERWEDALTYLAEFKQILPGNARLMADEAYCHAKLGNQEHALAILAEASRLSDSAECDYLAAVVAKQNGGPLDEIDALLDRALAREPALARQILADGAFADHAGRPRFDTAMRRALDEPQA